MNILISEDDTDILQLFELIVAEMGYIVFIAKDYTKTIEIIQNNHIDLLVLDYWLGNVKTEELMRIMASYNLKLNMPILLISAITNLSEVAARLNIAHYLKKPFNLEELRYKINQIIMN